LTTFLLEKMSIVDQECIFLPYPKPIKNLPQFLQILGVENCPPCAGVVRQVTEQLKRWRLT
jgi:hypothetical protein